MVGGVRVQQEEKHGASSLSAGFLLAGFAVLPLALALVLVFSLEECNRTGFSAALTSKPC